MIPEGTRVYTVRALAEHYRVSEATAKGWCAAEDFPAWSGTQRRRQYLAKPVDEWVKANRPIVWAAVNAPDKPAGPAAHPRDLLDADDFARARGERLGRKPVSAMTISGYVTRGQVPRPDRTPHDGKQPAVARNSWYRATVDANLATLTGSGNRTARGAEQ